MKNQRKIFAILKLLHFPEDHFSQQEKRPYPPCSKKYGDRITFYAAKPIKR